MPAEPEQPKEKSGGVSLQTLLISAMAAVVAATVVPRIWEAGTVFATAMTPVVVALVSEALKKPVQTVSAVPARVVRRTGADGVERRFEPEAARTGDRARVGSGRTEPFEPLPPARGGEVPVTADDDPFGLRAPAKHRNPRVRIAIVTGLLAFVIAAAVVTTSELALFGGSVSGERGRTTLFSGNKRSPSAERKNEPGSKATATATPTATPTDGEATPEATATAGATPSATATATPSATPAPAAPEASPVPTATP